MLAAHLRLARLLAQLDDSSLTPARRRRVEAALAEEVTLLWQTDEVRSRRPHVVDEIRHGLWFFEQSLLRVSELLLADYRRLLPNTPAPFHFGTWIGGDLDGNPFGRAGDDPRGARAGAHARARDVRGRSPRARAGDRDLESAHDALGRARRLDRPRRAGASRVRGRARGSQPRRAVPAQAQLRVERLRNALEGEGPAYETPSALASDLDVLDRSLRAGKADRVADGRLASLRRRVELFGFHLAKLDVRLHAEDLRVASDRARETRRRDRTGTGDPRPRGGRHADRVGDELGGRRPSRPRPRRRGSARALARPALRDDRVPPLGGGDRRTTFSTSRASAASSRRAAGGSRSWSATPTRARTAAT